MLVVRSRYSEMLGSRAAASSSHPFESARLGGGPKPFQSNRHHGFLHVCESVQWAIGHSGAQTAQPKSFEC